MILLSQRRGALPPKNAPKPRITDQDDLRAAMMRDAKTASPKVQVPATGTAERDPYRMRARVPAFLSNNPGATTREVAEGLDFSMDATGRWLKRLATDGLVIREGRDKHPTWRMAE